MITYTSQLSRRGAYRALALAGALALPLGCGGGGAPGSMQEPGVGRIQGKLTDDGGERQAGLGGSGTVSSASTVRASSVDNGGGLQTLGEAKVQAGGTYALDLPANREKLVVQALDASGQVLGAAILESSGSAAQTLYVTPISAESSVEARAFLEIAKAGVSLADTNTVDLRARIDGRVTAAVRAAAKAKGSADAELRALGQGIAVAQRTQIEAAARGGVQLTQAALFSAELQAAQGLSAALHTGKASAQADFLAALDAAAEQKGLGVTLRAQAEAQAGLGLRLTVKGLLDGAGAESKACGEAAAAASASLQARAASAALDATLKAQGAAQATLDSAAQASASLKASVDVATDSAAVASAYGRFSASVVGSGDVQATVLGSYLGVDATSKVAAQAAVTATLTAAAALDVSVKATATALVKVGAAVDAAALGKAVVDAFATYKAAVEAAAQTSLVVFTGKGAGAASVLLIASGGFRAGT